MGVTIFSLLPPARAADPVPVPVPLQSLIEYAQQPLRSTRDAGLERLRAGSGAIDALNGPAPLAAPGAGGPGAASFPQFVRPSGPAFEPDEILVHWTTATPDPATLNRMELEFKLHLSSVVELPRLGVGFAVYRIDPPGDAAVQRARLRLAYPELSIDVNTRYYPASDTWVLTGAGGSPRQYFNDRIKLPSDTRMQREIRIGMLDTSVSAGPSMDPARLIQRSLLDSRDTPAPAAHGNAVAALIAGRDTAHGFSGAAPGSRVYAGGIMRVKGDYASTNTALLLGGLEWLLSQDVQIINLSLAGVDGGGDAVAATAFGRLAQLPVVVIAAAGNAGARAPPTYPAAYRGVIAVTASDALDQVYGGASQGDFVALAAPGVDVWVPGADPGRYVTGTSFAAAIASGAGALILAARPTMSKADFLGYVCRNAKDLGRPGRDQVFGCGLLQVQPALDNASIAQP